MNETKDIISRIKEVCNIEQLTICECAELIGYFNCLESQLATCEFMNKPKKHTDIIMIKCNSK
ncbi:MAG: hypothetical protein NC253_14290 [Ruminococcus sp.]|nr:hypothetical protein [Ruminococcus sp.]MCM1381677.1 hypothetical protein [Muribaculaceae bacterium]MCM1480462.1 hypothetical protein [Muribaculaceae bacterium]